MPLDDAAVGLWDVEECWILLRMGDTGIPDQSRITSVFNSLCGIASLQIGNIIYSTQQLCVGVCSLARGYDVDT